MSADFETVIGLEVHVQLRTQSKMFCGCANTYGAPPNSLTCPVCTGQPGALPAPNRQAFALAIRFGIAVEAKIATSTHFDRKNYFYPDLPKGYQISQLDEPIVSDGKLALRSGQVVRIARAHLEEDAGKNFHVGTPYSLVDLNRCGIPLLEIVTGPDLRSAEDAGDYLARLKLLLRHLDLSDCDMEKGSLRCDVNVSVRRCGSSEFGTRVEVKNLNSFRSVERAIHFEAKRHEELVRSGGTVERETRLWDDDRGETRTLRKKEESEDYRYFPDPDLLPLHVEASWIESIRRTLPELPEMRRLRYTEKLGLSTYDAEVLISDKDTARFFDELVELSGEPKLAANYLISEIPGLLSTKGLATPKDAGLDLERLAALIRLIKSGAVNSTAAKQILAALIGTTKSPEILVQELGLMQVSDRGALAALVNKAFEAHPAAVADLRAGKSKAAGTLVGFVMKESKGRANPTLIADLIAEKIRES